ncbi:histidine--tRNA ligase [Lachnospira hominis (ex Liu et al. 2021)]|uniref:Histidine--tRNA ligase n=1 Tax=Lachnospira hominis (ex Liu et al. 2021) TaxID=2763051 RepID=A0ABR7G047_9FIRM|nr:histidine--tRNA ligase [Lachnospira hominis]MBC5680136.1 histidine--tRNA ligase [Lachnospira hominis]
MKITSVKGTNDYLPNEVEIRDYLQERILSVYKENGFEHIITPAIEDIENLDKSDGGENLNLIFKIMKRGDKLDKALASGVTAANENELADMGLRYDLTLPLSRYYANNKDKLTLPMKCIQIDRVYRAERPQKGRLREFIQCDIDIIGSESTDSEIELILTTTKALDAIGLKNYKVKLNDRRLLRAVLQSFGFAENDLDSVCITFDKMDKIGLMGVVEELTEKGFEKDAVDNFEKFLSEGDFTLESLKSRLEDKTPAESLEHIIDTVNELTVNAFELVFDLSLVRGQGYYTGTVFEVESIDFKGAVAGGGRYDHLIGKFLNEDIPAVGFSIGFERIFGILMNNGISIEQRADKIAVVYEDGQLKDAVKAADALRAQGKIASLYIKPKKLGKFLNKLEERGYDGFLNVGVSEEVSMFEK